MSGRVFNNQQFKDHINAHYYPLDNMIKSVAILKASDLIDVRRSDSEPPNIVGFAGQSGVAVGGITLDRNNTQACWAWMVADNVRLQAENAVKVAEQINK